MRLVDRFKKQAKNETYPQDLTSVVSGKVINIEDVNDDVFSEKMMGDGVAVIPNDNEVLAPADGEIISIYPTGHAINMHLDIGVDLIIHIGIDTVELNGNGFIKKVKSGQKVQRGDLLVRLDKKTIPAETDLTTMMLFPESKETNFTKTMVTNVKAGNTVVAKIIN